MPKEYHHQLFRFIIQYKIQKRLYKQTKFEKKMTKTNAIWSAASSAGAAALLCTFSTAAAAASAAAASSVGRRSKASSTVLLRRHHHHHHVVHFEKKSAKVAMMMMMMGKTQPNRGFATTTTMKTTTRAFGFVASSSSSLSADATGGGGGDGDGGGSAKTRKRYPSKFDSNAKANPDFTPDRYQTREENEQKTKTMKELKRNEYLEKIEKSQNKRDFQSSDHSNAIAGDGTVAKYYENVDIREVGGGGASNASSSNQYEILLDGKPLKSPKRAQFILPNKLLACAIATEWATQEDDLIRPFTMPLMQLSSTALDHMSDYATFDFHVKKLLEFFDADQAVVAHPNGSELREIQLKTLKKVHDWARREFGDQLNLSSDSIFAQPQPEEVKLLMEKRLRSLSPWEMTCTFAAAAAAKSLLIGLALNRNIIDAEEALKCARVEEDYQIERHGFVEGGHDIDISDLRVRLTAPHALNLILKAKTTPSS